PNQLVRCRLAQHELLLVLALLVTLVEPAVEGDDAEGLVLVLDFPFGPEHRLDDFLGREAQSHLAQVRPNDAAALPNLVARDARELGRAEHLGTMSRIAGRFR